MSDERHEWGPWIKHTPGPCPLSPGVWVMIEFYGIHVSGGPREYSIKEGRMTPALVAHDQWRSHGYGPWMLITRYRVRKPPAAKLLEEIARNVKAPKESVLS